MKKLLLTFTTLALLTTSSSAFASSYNDVSLTTKYGPAINFITEKNVVSGYSDGSYKPENLVNRAELSKILVGAFTSVPGGLDAYDTACFDDVIPGEWYTKYVCFLKANGYVKGYSDGTFRPDQPINLVEAIKIIFEIFKIEYEETSPWYKDLVNTAAEINLIALDFTSIDQKVTRGQMSEMVTRMMKYMENIFDDDSPVLDDYLGFLKDDKVTYQTLAKGNNVEFEARSLDKLDGAKALQFEVMNDSSKYQIALYSFDAVENKSTGCSEGYLSGNFKLSILSTNKSGAREKVLNEIDLGYKTIFPIGATHFVNMNYGIIPLDPIILVEEYGNCNGNEFTLFRPSSYYDNFEEIDLPNIANNRIYASSFSDFEFDLEAFNYKYYNNSTGKQVTKFYSWDEDLGAFTLDANATTEEDYPPTSPVEEQSLEEMGYIDLGHLFVNVVISSMKITNFDSFTNPGTMWTENDLTVSFQGEKNVTGEYKWNVLNNDFCFYPNSEDAQKLPRLENDDREVFICFNNSSEANDLFDSVNIAAGSSTEAEIKIDNYTYNYAETGYSYSNTATLLEIVEFK